MKTQTIKLASIRIDGGTQPRVTLDQNAVGEYADKLQDGATFPAVTVFFDGSEYWLADGFHRYFANKQQGNDSVKADVRNGTQRDARWYSFSVNTKHGLPRTRADVSQILRSIFDDEAWAKTSQSDVAKHTGIPQSTVQRHRKFILTRLGKYGDGQSEFVHPKTGKTSAMNTSNIGRSRTETVVVDRSTSEVMEDAEIVTTKTQPAPRPRGSFDEGEAMLETLRGVSAELKSLRGARPKADMKMRVVESVRSVVREAERLITTLTKG